MLDVNDSGLPHIEMTRVIDIFPDWIFFTKWQLGEEIKIKKSPHLQQAQTLTPFHLTCQFGLAVQFRPHNLDRLEIFENF